MSTGTFLLEHFYHGQIVRGGKPQGEPCLLAASEGVTSQIVEHALQRITLPPLIRSTGGAWALVRGRSRQIPFIAVQSQQGSAGEFIAHYVLLPSDVLKAFGGNLDALRVLVQGALPQFERLDQRIRLLEVSTGTPRTVDDQVEDILELMTTAKNRTALIEPMLAAIVQGVQLIVQGAPPMLDQRVRFIQGLLALLPPSARFGVTFATHSLPSTDTDVQIRFYSDDLPPEGTAVFNWAEGRLTGADVSDDYSRYIIAQLRLDAELVIQRNMAMASIAGWRLNVGDKLADSLAYASMRLRLDEALRNNQPVSKDEVSRILREDPTLSPDLQVLYALHLIRFSLAMEDMEHAAPIAVLLRDNPDLDRAVYEQMRAALDDDLAWLLYEPLLTWMNNPLGPQGGHWIQLTHRAVLDYLAILAEDEDMQEARLLFDELRRVGPALHLEELTPQLTRIALPLAAQDPSVAQEVLLLAFRYLPGESLDQLLRIERFRAQLDPALLKAWAVVEGQGSGTAEVLTHAARRFGETWEAVVLLRLSNRAQQTGRHELLYPPVTDMLYDIARTDEIGEYRSQVYNIVRELERHALAQIPQPGPKRLLQIHLVMSDYAELARQMLMQLRLYSTEDQEDYLRMIGEVFAEAPVPIAQLADMLREINEAGVRSVPLIVATISAIQGHLGAPEVDPIADRLALQLEDEQHLIDVVPTKAVLGLMRHYALRNNTTGMFRLATLVPRAVLLSRDDHTDMLTGIYKEVVEDPRARQTALHMLRTYVRMSEPGRTQRIISALVKEAGSSVQRPLQVTVMIRDVMGGGDLPAYAERVATSIDLLLQLAALYVDQKQMPTTNVLLNDLSSIPGVGGLSRDDHRRLVADIRAIGEIIITLGKQFQSRRSGSQHADQVATGRTEPVSAVDVLYMMGGALAEGHRYSLEVEAYTGAYPFARLSFSELVQGIQATAQILTGIDSTFDYEKRLPLTARDIAEEVRSMVRALPADSQPQALTRSLARDLQNFADLVIQTYDAGDIKAFENSSLARRIDAEKHRPRSLLELLRFLSGYYGKQI
ncbi:MAG: hypothetical protein ACOCX3_02655 [Chloroflexota bacterium]